METFLQVDMFPDDKLTAMLVTDKLNHAFYRVSFNDRLYALVSKKGICFLPAYVDFSEMFFAQLIDFLRLVVKQFH